MHDVIPNEDLTALIRIAQTLNRATDVQSALDSALAHLVELMGLSTGWISLIDRSSSGRKGEDRFTLAAHRNLPPGLNPDHDQVWSPTCKCQDLCRAGRLVEAYTEVRCSRLEAAQGDTQGLTVHASAPLVSGDRMLGILNIATKDWSYFNPRSLALLNIVGNQIGVALERAQLFDLMKEQRTHEQAVLLVFSSQLLSGFGLQELTKLLVDEVTSMLEADACSMLLLDEDNELLEFVAASGWDSDPVELNRRIPLEAKSGPGWVIRTRQPLLVEDLLGSDPTAWSPSWLESEGFRGHAIVPLVAEDRAIGALVMNNRAPRMLTEDELRLLQLMANQAAIAIETARLQVRENERRRMEQELAIGRKMQRSLLPADSPRVPGYELGVRYQAAREVGGDFYDFCWVPGEKRRLGLIIGDVSGKGVPAALFMAMCRTNLRAAVLSGRSPSAALQRANELILNDSQAEVFLSAIYALLDPQTGRLSYANGGHNRPLLIQGATGEILELSARGIILGEFEEVAIEEQHIELSPGDALILYTDGITEAIDADQQAFGEERLKEVLGAHAGESPEELVSAVTEALQAFIGTEPNADDFTIVAIARKRSP